MLQESAAPPAIERAEHLLTTAVQWLQLLVEVLGALAILVGILAALGQVTRAARREATHGYQHVRLTLARHLALALEFQLAADILATAVAPTWSRIGQLAAVAVIRTALNYFLTREIREVRVELGEEPGAGLGGVRKEGGAPLDAGRDAQQFRGSARNGSRTARSRRPPHQRRPPVTTPPSLLADRRAFMQYFAGLGLGTTLLPGVLWARVAGGEDVTPAAIASAEELAGVTFTPEQREMMVDELKDQARQRQSLQKIALPNAVPPAVQFSPLLPGMRRPAMPAGPKPAMIRERVPLMAAPANLEELAFAPVSRLAELVRTRKVTPTALTRMYLARIERIDPQLQAVVSLTTERALRQAKAADEEIARGKYRGPLHGIPWGAKDLLATKGYRTTWGAGPYKAQTIDEDATVVQRLDAAGAVLVAKLTLGELAMGDVWYGGRTKNPWRVAQGSSGSSAGPGSATAAGLVGFSIGSETLGSISSPATRNGVTGLRPTFGRVPKTGAMALSWSMDKLGPMCRSVEDCALVLDAIHGSDGQDLTAMDAPFHWNARLPLAGIRVGYVKSAFDAPERDANNRVTHATKSWDDAALAALRKAGVNAVPVELPQMEYDGILMVLMSEAAAAFDELTRSGRDKELVQQGKNDWANQFRAARFISAVDYINANRARTLAMREWAKLMATVDVIVVPTFGTSQLLATNLTGHPAVILPHGFREDGTPVSLTFLGGLYEEAKLLRVAHAFQMATDWHTRVPKLEAVAGG